MKNKFLWLLLFICNMSVSQTLPNVWEPVAEESIQRSGERVTIPEKYKTFKLKVDDFKNELSKAPHEDEVALNNSTTIIELPMADGSLKHFRIVESSIMVSERAAQFPTIKTYDAMGIEEPGTYGKLDFTILGFHGMLWGTFGNIFIDPYQRNDITKYLVYYEKDYTSNELLKCGVKLPSTQEKTTDSFAPPLCSGTVLSTYRLAIACTNEYANSTGSPASASSAEAAITTTMNRVNGVFQTRLGITFDLIIDHAILFTDPVTDPFTGITDLELVIIESQKVIDKYIGNDNYDVGMTFSSVSTNTGAGMASLGSACQKDYKAMSAISRNDPLQIPYAVTVMHEMGHLFGAQHTFNRCNSSLKPYHAPGTMVEPGSGTTIMSYGGLCGLEDKIVSDRIQSFHAVSFDQIRGHVIKDCGIPFDPKNHSPDVHDLQNYVIPKLTPFELVGSANDPDGNPLFYSWEEIDNNSIPHDLGNAAPYFRSYDPIASPRRTFPSMPSLLNPQVKIPGEYLPNTAQTLNFRLTAFDEIPTGGGVCFKNMKLIIADAGPFKITSQQTAPVIWGACKTETITWDVANTNLAPIYAKEVDVFFTMDGGATLTPLLTGIPNNGSCNITVPSVSTTSGRILIKAINNVFFAVNPVDISISGLCANFESSLNGVPVANVEKGQTVVYTDKSFGDPTEWQWTFEGGTPATSTNKNESVTYATPGTYKVELRVLTDKAKGSSVIQKDSIIRKDYITVGTIYNKGTAYTCIAMDTAKNIWTGTDKAGLFFLDKKTDPAATQFKLLLYASTFDPTKFIIQSIACDSMGNTWVGHTGAGGPPASFGGLERIDYNDPATIQHITPTSKTRCSPIGAENDKLATRNVACVATDKNNTVWTAHKFHEISPAPDYMISPGGFSFKSPTATAFTTKSSWEDYFNQLEPPELPYPAYTCKPGPTVNAQPRNCYSVACGPNEVWVDVSGYSAINEVFYPSRILRYDLNGNFLSAIDFKTAGIPGGGNFNGIYISPRNNAWLTVPNGFAARTNGIWKYTPLSNLSCVIPSGTIIHLNAIWGNKFGNVFIGTNKGLIVYKGNGNVSSATSYSFYGLAKSDGTGRKVTGGVSEQDSIQWISTNDGIVRSVIGKYDMTQDEIDYTSCNNAEINGVEAELAAGSSSYYTFEVVTIVADKKTTRYPDHCTAEHVYGMLKKDVRLTAPVPGDYPLNMQDIFKQANNNGPLFTLLTKAPFETAFDALTVASLLATQNSSNPSVVIPCTQKYKLYNNGKGIVMRYLYDQGPLLRYFTNCNWNYPPSGPYDFQHSMDATCGNKLLDVQYDPVWMFANDKEKMITSYTAKGSIAYPGKIERTIVEECGVVKIITKGVGLQYCGDNCRGQLMGRANGIIGEHLFREIDKRVKIEFENGN